MKKYFVIVSLMKLRLIFVKLAIMFLAITISSCHNGNKNPTQVTDSLAEIYTCSMHPQIQEHHPGNCPICGMELVKKNTPPAVINNTVSLETLLKPVNEYVITTLPVIVPQQKAMAIPVKAYGTIEYDPRAAGTISARLSGRIEKLFVKYRYQQVSKGQKIMEIYSPELLTAQQNLLFLLKNDAANISFIKASKEKLLLLGMSGSELNQVEQSGKPLYSVGVYSNYNGHIHDAEMNGNLAANEMKGNEQPLTKELALKEGTYVQKGQALFMIMSHHNVWVSLQIFADDISLVKKGDAVRIAPETDTAAVIRGAIDFIEPFYRNNSKTLTARVYFQNNHMLPVGSQVSAEIETKNRKGLWLPQAAVLSLGLKEVVFLKLGNNFIAHKVTTGIRTNNETQIIEGLMEKDTVAVNAQYLVDNESFIKTNQ